MGSLYVDKAWHGQGVGGALMQKVIEWADPEEPVELGVVIYNERAKAFTESGDLSKFGLSNALRR